MRTCSRCGQEYEEVDPTTEHNGIHRPLTPVEGFLQRTGLQPIYGERWREESKQ